MMRETPLGHDRATTGHNTGGAFSRHRHIAQQHTRVDGEVIHPLFGLLDQGVAEHFPSQVFSNAVNFFQRLIDGHGANRYGRITNDPLAGFVNVFTGG